MINKLIEKELRSLGAIELHRNLKKEDIIDSYKGIIVEVATMFRYASTEETVNNLYDQIINEVS